MPTPDNSQTLVPCANPNCDKLIPAGGRRKYCTDECRWEHTNSSRKGLSRLRHRFGLIASDEEMLTLLVRLAESPTSPGERRDATWQELSELDALLSQNGPTPDIRSQIKTRASAIRQEFMLQPPRTADEASQYIHSLKILVDVGAERSSDVPRLRQHAREVVQFYLRIKDDTNLSRALIAYANNWRLDNHEYRGKCFFTYPYHILREYRGKRDLNYWTLLHNATLWNFRFSAENLSRLKQRITVNELIALTRDVDTPAAWLETYRELAAYWGGAGRNRDRALEESEKIEQLQRKYTFPRYGLPSLLRPKIHMLLDSGIRSDRDEAIHLIEGPFLKLYQTDRHFYYYDLLKVWKVALGLPFELPKPTYGSAILTYLPRN